MVPQENCYMLFLYELQQDPPPLVLSQKILKGELTMMGVFLFFMYAFLCHLLIYCFLATNVSFLALFCDTGARFFKLFFSFASWLDARPCQQTALERHCKFGRERLFFPSALFFYMVGSGYAGALAVFLDRRMVLGSYTGGWFLSPRQKDGSWVLHRRFLGSVARSLQCISTHCLQRQRSESQP